jgi:hypothetical protein
MNFSVAKMETALKLENPVEAPVPYSPISGVALFRDLGFSQRKYRKIKRGAKDRNADIYPTEKALLTARKETWIEMR